MDIWLVVLIVVAVSIVVAAVVSVGIILCFKRRQGNQDELQVFIE